MSDSLSVYSSPTVPTAYRCDDCGATGCKLWRSQAIIPFYYCVNCVKVRAGIADEVDADGERPDHLHEGMKTNQFMQYIPALLIDEGDGHWNCTSAPFEVWKWWRRLPTNPTPPTASAANAGHLGGGIGSEVILNHVPPPGLGEAPVRLRLRMS